MFVQIQEYRSKIKHFLTVKFGNTNSESYVWEAIIKHMKLAVKILKWIGIVIASLFIISFVLPGKSHVERTRVIKADIPIVFNLVNDLHLWKKWSPWYRLDTAATMEYYGGGIGKGSGYSWSSNNKNVGKGKMMVTDVKDKEYINSDLTFEGMGTSKVKYTFSNEADGTKVTWSMDSYSSELPVYMRPMSKYFNLFMDKMIGPDFEKGLQNMDSVILSKK